MVHASPTNPLYEYIRPEDFLYSPNGELSKNFQHVARLAFVGHSHQPFIGIQTDTNQHDLVPYKQFPGGYPVPDGTKVIINAGSVGRPRDGDWRASYATVGEDGRIQLRRVKYDLRAAAQQLTDSGINRWVRVNCAEEMGWLAISKDPSLKHGDLSGYLASRLSCGR